MRKRLYNILIVMLLCICSIVLTSCKAITAQNITYIDSDDSINDNIVTKETIKPDFMGKIVSVSVDSIKVELIEQTQNNKSLSSNAEKEDDDMQVQTDISRDLFENNYTGIEKKLTVSEDIQILQGTSMELENGELKSKSYTNVLDLKKGEIIMGWYKQNTEIVEKISVM
ncbi:hypothetical protein NNC19_22075 [Clostridium sp. SHJSY1]|uniref:hypothetical protein n=1 Tax=Clostridium sp. SHJSY1 TaxID=2942483 RepID=UPI002876BCEC|nr:hypothetical protein [Clostridium sp. SHJSY1]MDS0528380.1 hypothetical protein [Clostridium sp. SHJSY1]